MLNIHVNISFNETLVQLRRYTFVGGIAFLIDFGFLFLFTECLNFYYLISAGIAFLLGLTTNYVLSISWVFNRRSINNKYIEFLIFGVIGIVGLFLNEIFIWIFTELIYLHYLLSKIFTTFFVYIWNFFARKYILFQ